MFSSCKSHHETLPLRDNSDGQNFKNYLLIQELFVAFILFFIDLVIVATCLFLIRLGENRTTDHGQNVESEVPSKVDKIVQMFFEVLTIDCILKSLSSDQSLQNLMHFVQEICLFVDRIQIIAFSVELILQYQLCCAESLSFRFP